MKITVSNTKKLKIATLFVAALLLTAFVWTFRMNRSMYIYQMLHVDGDCTGCCGERSNHTDTMDDNTSNCQLPDSKQLYINGITCTKLPIVCLNESCKTSYVRHLQMEDSYPIPKLRHIIWKNEYMSEYFAEQLRSWQTIHPDWTFILWRDADLEPFVAAYFPGLLPKFKSLPETIMKVDMIRYMLLYKYGGVYADLDYSLVRSLDKFRRFHAVITREPDAHSLQLFGLTWPVKFLANPAFMMSAPGHAFYLFAMQQLESKIANDTFSFAGPFGLTEIIENYQRLFQIANNAMQTVYVPPSYSFYPYKDNRMRTGSSEFITWRLIALMHVCLSLKFSSELENQNLKQNTHLRQYCTDVNNMDPITDKMQPVFAIHDTQKSASVYAEADNKLYNDNLTHAQNVIWNLKFGKDFL